MSGDAQTQLHDAVVKALAAAVKPVPVFEHVPQTDPNKRKYPYLTVGENEQEEFDTYSERGQRHRLTIHVWSRQRGNQEVRDLLKQVRDALDDQALTMAAGAALVFIYYEFSSVLPVDPDGVTHHGVARYRAVTTET